MPTLESINIQGLGGLMVPIFRVREDAGRIHNFNVSQISDGTLRVIGILTAPYQPNRAEVLALEEPEQTVNPAIVGLLAEAIQQSRITGSF
jgi:predicted ATPase